MEELQIFEVADVGNDQLLVRAHRDGEIYEARAWKSALEQHPVDDTRDEQGHRVNEELRPMTGDEQREYLLQRLVEQNPELAERPAHPVAFELAERPE